MAGTALVARKAGNTSAFLVAGAAAHDLFARAPPRTAHRVVPLHIPDRDWPLHALLWSFSYRCCAPEPIRFSLVSR
jgi:hypothetical protein